MNLSLPRMSPYLLFFFFVFSVRLGSAFPSRSLLRAIKDPDLPDAAVDLNATTFDRALRDSPASFAVVEFFAHWCPACRNYKPQYEKVARLFNGPDAVHPGIVFMARVDCATKINTQLCERFSIRHYPMLLWGPPSKFAVGGWEIKEGNKSEIQYIDDGRTAERLLNWINKRMGRKFSCIAWEESENRRKRNTEDLESGNEGLRIRSSEETSKSEMKV